MTEPILSLNNLTVGYGKTPVVADANFAVHPGEIVTLIGPNGAGKSTLLKTITRQLPPLSGTVSLMGHPLASLSGNEMARTMALVMTNRVTPELMTCYDVVSSGRYPYTGALGVLQEHDRQEVQSAMELVGVAELADRDFEDISDGQRQLVMLARAICQTPKLLILDEPTSFLDIRHKLLLLAILKDLIRQRDLAVLMSLHELDLAQKVSDRVVCVAPGRIARTGTPDEVFSRGYIERFFRVTDGSYDELFGSPELKAPSGAPRVFVIGGGGTGIPVYRRLQRMGVAFDAGILAVNDLDVPVARALGHMVIEASAFGEPTEGALAEAYEAMAGCQAVICTVETFGTHNQYNRELRDTAAKLGLLVAGPDEVSEHHGV